MLKQDKEFLSALVQEYSFKEIVRSLAEISANYANDYSDMHLKDLAIKMSDTSENLLDAAENMAEL
jgi:hypothetical protein